jgi:hypothetical protein
MGVSGQCHVLAVLYTQAKEPLQTHWIGVWVGLRAGLDTQATGNILCLCWRSNPNHSVCSHTASELIHMICGVLNDTIISSGYIELDGRMMMNN